MSCHALFGLQPPIANHMTTCLFGGPDAINYTDRTGRTALHTAIARGRSKAAETLLRKGANPNMVDNEGFTALHLAVVNCRIDLVRLLLRYGADCKCQTCALTPLELALKILSETVPEFSPLSMTSPVSANPLLNTTENIEEDVLSSSIFVNSANINFTHTCFQNFIIRALYQIIFALLRAGSEISFAEKAPGQCCRLLEEAVTSVTKPYKDNMVYTDLPTYCASVEKLYRNGCRLPKEYNLNAKACEYTHIPLRRRLFKILCLVLEGPSIRELVKIGIKNKDKNMIAFILACGHRGHLEDIFKTDDTAKELLVGVRQPNRLSDLCRINIRDALSVNEHGCSVSSIGALPLPKSVKNFLIFSEWLSDS